MTTDSDSLRITDWAMEDRPREKLMAQGAAALSNAELLAILIGSGTPKMTAVELMKLVLEQKIAHGGHPVLRWMMDNIFIRTDPAGNIKPDKEKSTEKIDGIVALVMALDRCIRHRDDTESSVYDERELLVF